MSRESLLESPYDTVILKTFLKAGRWQVTAISWPPPLFQPQQLPSNQFSINTPHSSESCCYLKLIITYDTMLISLKCFILKMKLRCHNN